VADWLWKGPTSAEIEAAFVQEQRAALQNLVQLPNARLERCLIEHLDCCSYRLDAWRTGLFAERLAGQRAIDADMRRPGIHLGAFGWLEDLRPSPRTFVSPDAVPPSLRPADGAPVLEEDAVGGTGKQGGFVQAPSPSHAAAAALLRSGYLAHAAPEQADLFAVNLSSERV